MKNYSRHRITLDDAMKVCGVEWAGEPLRKLQGELGGHIKLRGLGKPVKRAAPEPPT